MAEGGFTVIPRALFEELGVPVYAKLVVATLASYHASGRRLTHQQIADYSGCSVSSVQRALRWLRERGYVTWETQVGSGAMKQPNAYTLTFTVSISPDSSDRSEGPNDRSTEAEPQENQIGHTDRTIGHTDRISTKNKNLRTTDEEPRTRTSSSVVEKRDARARAWNPHPGAVERATANAKLLDLDLHIDHYLVRCKERGTEPSSGEWLRWFLADEQQARIKADALQRQRGIETDETGTPLTWHMPNTVVAEEYPIDWQRFLTDPDYHAQVKAEKAIKEANGAIA